MSREEKLLDYERNLADNRKEAFKEGFEKGFKEGFEKGLKEGLKLGFLEGRIFAMEEWLGMAVTSFSELERLPLEELQSRVQQLQSQVQQLQSQIH